MTIKISDVFPSLSRRQRQVCALIVSGQTSKEIGRSLGISNRTVEDHKREIFANVQVKSIVELVCKTFGSPEVVA